MKTDEQLAREIAAAVAGVSHNVNFRDIDGNDTVEQSQAVYMHLSQDGLMVFINNEETDVEITFDPNKTDMDWFKDTFKPMMQNVAKRYLYGTTIRSYAGNITPKSMVHRTVKESSRNTCKTSYKPLGGTRIILRHSKAVNEESPGARSRNIKAIFIEKAGERFKYPHTHLLGARVMGLHVESGGKPWDAMGEKICEISRRRKDIMELLRWSKRLGEDGITINEVRAKGKSEVIMLRRMMERAARTGMLDEVLEYTLPTKQSVVESLLATKCDVADALLDLQSKLDIFI